MSDQFGDKVLYENVSVMDEPQPLRVNNGIPVDSQYADFNDLMAEPIPHVEEVWLRMKKMKVRVRAISGKERDAYEQSLTMGKGANQTINMRNARAKLAVLALANPDGSRMLKDADAGKLGEMHAIDLESIFDRARKLAGLTNEDMDELTGE